MKRGRVIGEVWATRMARGLSGRSLKLVALVDSDGDGDGDDTGDGGRPTGTVVVALDTLDARTGQQVLLAFGSGARNVLRAGPENRHLLCDAAVALVLDPDPPAPAAPGERQG